MPCNTTRWVLVPTKVTNEMIDAANNVPSGIAGSPPHWQWVWDAMLDAAPTAPTADAPVAMTDTQIEAITYEEYTKRQGHESDFDCILKVVKRCLGVSDEPRRVEGHGMLELDGHER